MKGTLLLRLEVELPGTSSSVKLLCDSITKFIHENTNVQVEQIKFSDRIRKKRETRTGLVDNSGAYKGAAPYPKSHKRSGWYVKNTYDPRRSEKT